MAFTSPLYYDSLMLMSTLFAIFSSISLVSAPPPELLSQNHDFLIRQLKSDSPDLKINALDKLGELKNPAAIPAMAEALQDSDSDVRYHAIRALSRSPLQEALTALQDRVPAGQPSKETDPYLAAEIRRGVKSTEDLIKANTAAAENSKSTKQSNNKSAAKKSKK